MSTRALLLLTLAASPLAAQTQQAAPPANPVSLSLQRSFATVSDYLVRSAEAMPADKYGFQASSDVRTFAQEIAHVIDAHYAYCSRGRNEASPMQSRLEGTLSDKEALVAKLAESTEYCKAAYDGMTDGSLADQFQVGNARGTRFAALMTNVSHDNEHYGKVVTYLRMNGIVPPSSQPRR